MYRCYVSLTYFQTLLPIILLPIIHSYGTGPPPSACVSMFPSHGVPPQSSSPPYVISLNATSYTPNDVIQVTISGINEQFRGTLIQAREEGQFNTIGKFTVSPGDDHIHAATCDRPNDAVSHYRSVDSSTKTFYWTAPSSITGNIVFVGTFVKWRSKFWINVRSVTLTERSQPQTTTASTTATTTITSTTTLVTTPLPTTLSTEKYTTEQAVSITVSSAMTSSVNSQSTTSLQPPQPPTVGDGPSNTTERLFTGYVQFLIMCWSILFSFTL